MSTPIAAKPQIRTMTAMAKAMMVAFTVSMVFLPAYSHNSGGEGTAPGTQDMRHYVRPSEISPKANPWICYGGNRVLVCQIRQSD